jgi:DnaB helicase-like protein
VLGAVLLDERHLYGLVADEHLRPEHFYREQHGAVFAAMLRLHDLGRQIDHLTIAEKLRENGQLEQIGGCRAQRSRSSPPRPRGRSRPRRRRLHPGHARLPPAHGRVVTRMIRRAKDKKLVYVAVHNHGGTDSVGFSEPDLASHERGYPTLLRVSKQPVGGLVSPSEPRPVTSGSPTAHGRTSVAPWSAATGSTC